jgi:thiol-disulfide isomerase/thioredoxin
MRMVLVAMFCVCMVSAHAAHVAEPQVGEVPPNFSAKNAVTGEPIELAAYMGQVVIVTFWATWCAPCREELPILENLQRKLPPEALRVIAISFHETPGAFKAIKKDAADWKIALIEDVSAKISRAYDIQAIPHMFIIGRDGKVAAVRVGYGQASVDELVKIVNAVLKAP